MKRSFVLITKGLVLFGLSITRYEEQKPNNEQLINTKLKEN